MIATKKPLIFMKIAHKLSIIATLFVEVAVSTHAIFQHNRSPQHRILSNTLAAALLLTINSGNAAADATFASGEAGPDRQLVRAAQSIGNLKGYASVCNILQSPSSQAYREAVADEELILRARYAQLGLDKNLLQADELTEIQKIKSDHLVDTNSPDCHSSIILHIIDVDRHLIHQVVAFIQSSPDRFALWPNASNNVTSNTPGQDSQIFAFAVLVGSLKGGAEVCGIKNAEYEDLLQSAEYVAKAGYHQLGLDDQTIDRDEKRGYDQSLADHAFKPDLLPNCSLFSRQIDNIEEWVVRQGANIIVRSQNR